MDLNKMSDYGLITQEEWVDGVAEVTGLSSAYVRQHIQATQVRNQSLVEYIQQLRTSYKVGLLSNIGMGAMDQFFSVEERNRLFDAAILSGEVGLVKPHPEIFRIAAERLGCLPGECIMIDDSLDNCAGADAAGMQAIYYQDNHYLKERLTVLLGESNA
jgi:HAD superfamily hydrolase (TIGR01509 family)